jgi:hypothetical protein
MLGICANNPNDSTTMDDLALITYLFDRRPDFHWLNPVMITCSGTRFCPSSNRKGKAQPQLYRREEFG